MLLPPPPPPPLPIPLPLSPVSDDRFWYICNLANCGFTGLDDELAGDPPFVLAVAEIDDEPLGGDDFSVAAVTAAIAVDDDDVVVVDGAGGLRVLEPPTLPLLVEVDDGDEDDGVVAGARIAVVVFTVDPVPLIFVVSEVTGTVVDWRFDSTSFFISSASSKGSS